MNCITWDSPIGKLYIAAGDTFISGLWFEGQRCFPSDLSICNTGAGSDIQLATIAWLTAYFAGKQPEINALPLCPKGSEFQWKVWTLLLDIPYGETVSYGELARKLENSEAKKVSAQAVGGAVGRNPISIMIPCHRVIGAAGQLTGYAGGIERKRWLLQHESKNELF